MLFSLDRLNRVYKRAKTPARFSQLIAEELLVRAWSSTTVRSASSVFIRNYYPEKWVFVVGCFNSGTTLLQKILASHPGVSGPPREGVRFTDVLSNLEENGHHMIWDEKFQDYKHPAVSDIDALRKIKKDWGLFWQSGSNVFLDKSVANTARIGWLNRAFPNAYFIGIHRNGLCVTEGLRRRAMPPQWYQKREGSQQYTYETIANQWVLANELMLSSFENMPNSLIVRFEDLVADPLQVTQSCVEFLQLETEMVSQSENTLYMGGKRFDIHNPNPASLERIGRTGRCESKPMIEKMMHRLGYEI